MRRRDATGQHLFFPQQGTGWPALVCIGLSIGLHGVVLGVATLVVLSGGGSTELIRVALLPGGGGNAAPGAPVQPAPAAPVAETERPPRQPQQAQRPRVRMATSRRAHVETPDRGSASASATAADATLQGADTGAGSEASAGAGGNGSGHGGASGDGDGSDQRAACLYCPEPRYPFIARARGWQGSVDVGLLVLADGTVDAASLRHSSGYGVLDEAAIAVARQSRFSPPAAQGLPAPLHGRIEYRFELTNAH